MRASLDQAERQLRNGRYVRWQSCWRMRDGQRPRTLSCLATRRAARASRRPRCTSPSRCMNVGPAGRDHRSRLPPEELHPLHRATGAPGPARAGLDAQGAGAFLHRARRDAAARRERGDRVRGLGRGGGVGRADRTISSWSIRPAPTAYLMRLAHSMADTLITPLNDSFVDFDVLGTVDPHDLRGHRREPLCRDGARRAPPAPHGRRRAVWTGSWCATGSRCWARATSGWSARGSRSSARGSASAAPTGSPSAWSIASSFRAG